MSDDPSNRQDPASASADIALDEAVKLYRSGDFAEAAQRFERLAEQGSAAAMTWIGYVYLKGKGVEADPVGAMQWFERADKAGDAEAGFWIGNMHHHGRGIPADLSLAQERYLKAAEAGETRAMTSLGDMYFRGEGVDADMTLARHWYLKGAEAGDAEGQHNLAALLFAAGKGEEAERWTRKAAAQDYEPSVAWTQDDLAYRMIGEKRFKEALPILEKAARLGSAWAHGVLGTIYGGGQGVAKDVDLSLRHFETAYDGGQHWVAGLIAGLHYRADRPQLALEWWRKETTKPISALYWQYRTLKKFPELEAYPGERDELLNKAAEAGHVFAQRDVAFRMIKARWHSGSRLEGIRRFLNVLKRGWKMATRDACDERLG